MYAFDGTSLDYTLSITPIRITRFRLRVFSDYTLGFHSVALGLQHCSDLCSRRFGLHTYYTKPNYIAFTSSAMVM